MPPITALSLLSALSLAIISVVPLVNGKDVHLKTFSPDFVRRYIATVANGNVSEKCKDSLLKVEPFLWAYDTIPMQRQLFYGSYAAGDLGHVRSRDQDRWHFRFRSCITAAAEDTVVASEQPMTFCTADDSTLRMAVCVPTPCVDDHLYLLREWRRQALGRDKEGIVSTRCTKSRLDRQWWELTAVVIETASCFFIFGAVFFATAFHWYRGEQAESKWMQLFLAFSVIKTFKMTTTVPTNPSSVIRCIWGIRVIATWWVVLGHSGVFLMDFIAEADQYKEELIHSFFYQPLTNGPISVDVFFVLSGVLLAYHWFRSIKKPGALVPTWSSWQYWLGFYQHRALRLWPTYAYVIFLSIVRIPMLRYHENYPIWGPDDHGVLCATHCWENLLFLNSFTESHCMPWTWYIGTDFAFFAVSPIFLLALKWSPVWGIVMSVVTIITSSGLLTLETLRHNFPPTQLLFLTPERFNQNSMLYQELIYVKPQYRIGAYLIGLLIGYLLSTYDDATKEYPKPSKRVVRAGWTFCIIAFVWSIYGLMPSLQGWDWPLYHMAFTALHRPVFALSFAWLIYACQRGFGGWLNSFLSLRIFCPLSVASYSLYLLHLYSIFVIYMSTPFPIPHHGFRTLIYFFIQHIVFCYAIAFALMACIEMPAVNIFKVLLGSTQQRLKAAAKKRDSGAESTSSRDSDVQNNNLRRRLRTEPRRA